MVHLTETESREVVPGARDGGTSKGNGELFNECGLSLAKVKKF